MQSFKGNFQTHAQITHGNCGKIQIICVPRDSFCAADIFFGEMEIFPSFYSMENLNNKRDELKVLSLITTCWMINVAFKSCNWYFVIYLDFYLNINEDDENQMFLQTLIIRWRNIQSFQISHIFATQISSKHMKTVRNEWELKFNQTNGDIESKLIEPTSHFLLNLLQPPIWHPHHRQQKAIPTWNNRKYCYWIFMFKLK